MSPLERLITQKAQKQIPYWFCDFMNDALYTPEYGYYRNEREKFGQKGDFITAPTLSPLFGKTLSNSLSELLCSFSEKNILEFGSGKGHLAADILSVLGDRLSAYFILELSGTLIKAQKETLLKYCPQWAHKVHWLKTLPTSFRGVILANELLDALPVHRFRIQNHQVELQAIDPSLHPYWLPALPDIAEKIVPLQLPQGYTSEYSPWLTPWLHSIGACLDQGFLLLLDYGFPESEFYHPERCEGTLICHYQHRTLSNPFLNIGQQDISAHVNFTAVAYGGTEAGLRLRGYTTQGAFLLDAGIEKLLTLGHPNPAEGQALQTLIAPHEMGELFKVMLFQKNTSHLGSIPGFNLQDDRVKL